MLTVKQTEVVCDLVSTRWELGGFRLNPHEDISLTLFDLNNRMLQCVQEVD